MPKELEQKLFRQGRKRGLREELLDAYVYGTLRKLGWRPRRERSAKKKHS